MKLDNNIIPKIYKPIRVTHSSAMLINNIYLDAELYRNIKSFIVKTDISDHYMCLTLIQDNLSEVSVNQSFTFCKITDSALRNEC